MTVELKPGQKAPDFTLNAGDCEKVSLSALKGKKVVLYFYPRDNTPGRTREACAFLVNDEEGKILKIFPKVKVDGHVDRVLEALKAG